MAVDSVPFDLVRLGGRSRRCHKSTFLNGLLSVGLQAFFVQPWIHLVMPYPAYAAAATGLER